MQQNGPIKEGNFLESQPRVLTLQWINFQTNEEFNLLWNLYIPQRRERKLTKGRRAHQATKEQATRKATGRLGLKKQTLSPSVSSNSLLKDKRVMTYDVSLLDNTR